MSRPSFTALAAALVLTVLSPAQGTAQGTRFLRQPAVSATEIAFVHANDIWGVARAGGQARRLTSDEGAETEPAFSADGKWIAFTGQYGGNQDVYVVPAEGGQVTRVDTDRYAHPERTMNPVWSPDSRYIAYARRLDTQLRAIFVHDTETGDTHQITDGMAEAITPVWDESQEYLYFLASTNYGLNPGWLDMTAYDHPVTRALYVAILQADGASPFLPRSDEEASSATDDDEESGEEESGTAPPDVVLDLEDMAARIVPAPTLPLRNYTGLIEGPEGQVFVTESILNQRGLVLHRYSLEDREATEYASGVVAPVVSADRSKILYRAGSPWSVVSTAGAPPKNGDGRLSLGDLRVCIEPEQEWSQMLRDGWRFMRDFLYVDNQHGTPWDDVWAWYSACLPDVGHRSDFNQLLDMVSGEIAVGHSYVRGGDYPDLTSPRTGLLGADIEEVDGFFRIEPIYSGESWNPGLMGPLAHPGLGVSEGDFIVGIDGRELRAPTNPYMLLGGSARRTVTLIVNDRPSLDGAREVIVQPVANEGQLRSGAWIEGNRKKVDELSDGRIAYVYIPNTGQGGYTYFNRMYFAQQDRQGAVIDERNNGGGSAADYIMDVMVRDLTGYFNLRANDHKPWTQPMAGLWGPKVMIINEQAGSGGDLMPYLFRFREVGPLVGMRTWGGLVGNWDTPPLIDGGSFVAPRGGFFDVNGEWAIEAEGIAPDIEVMNTPKDVAAGRDAQLEAAVAEALRLMEIEGVQLMSEPAAPTRYRRPGGNR